MSYCRFSDNDFQCDVYCYQDVSGQFVIHVAQSKPVPDDSMPPPLPDGASIDDVVARSILVSQWLRGARRRNLGLEHDGETFILPTAKEAAAKMIDLRNAGYRVPEYAIDSLIEEVSK